MKSLLCFSLLFLSLGLLAQSYSGPESVEFDAANNRYLVANTSSHTIQQRSSNGTITLFASGGMSTGPHGLEIVGDTLYACSGANLKAFNLNTGANLFTINMGATFLNGITYDNSGNLFISDFTGKKIYKYTIANQNFSAVASSLVQSPNGITLDAANNRIIFVNWGSNAPLKALDITTYSVTTLFSTGLSNCDGIARDAAGNYFISNWGNQSIVKYDASLSNPTTVVTGLSSPADIYYNTATDTLAIPNSGNNTVTFVYFGSTGIQNSLSDATFSVFPNPAGNEIQLKNLPKDCDIKIYDLNGRCVLTGAGNKIQVHSLTNGKYLIVASDKNGQQFKSSFIKN